MNPIKIFLILGLCLSFFENELQAQLSTSLAQTLDKKSQRIVTISAYTATGDLVQLQSALNEGLDAGLTVNEVKEVLVQLYAYAGFPRSLNALQTFMDVLKKRRSKGINDPMGRQPSPLTSDKSKLDFGTEIQTKLVGMPVKGEVYSFAPAIDQFLKEHLFGDIFGRDNLDWKSREIATISALASLGAVESQLRGHFGVGLHNGLTEGQLNQLVFIIQSKVNAKEGANANQILQTVLKQRKNGKSNPETTDQHINSLTTNNQFVETIFPKGEKIMNANFIGNAWLQQLVVTDSSNDTQVGSVTFEPGARTKWHLHPDGQILLAIDGVGYYQEKGSTKRILHKGDVVKCPPNVPHWHGASPDQMFIQVAITSSTNGPTVWMQAVSDKEYN